MFGHDLAQGNQAYSMARQDGNEPNWSVRFFESFNGMRCNMKLEFQYCNNQSINQSIIQFN